MHQGRFNIIRRRGSFSSVAPASDEDPDFGVLRKVFSPTIDLCVA